MQIVFGRKVTGATPGRFQTKVITRGVQPVIQAHYKHSKVKQYLKEGRALGTETTVNDPYNFGVGRLLTAENWQALLTVGEQTNQRLLDAQLAACDCAPDPTALARIVLPSTHDGLPAPGLRFGDPRVMALLARLCHYGHLFNGLTNRSLRELIAALIPGYSTRQATYDLRRVGRKGLIRRIPHRQRYELTNEGRGSPSSSPRPTPGSSTPPSPNWTPTSPTTSPPDRRWHAPGAPSHKRSIRRSNRPLSRPENMTHS